jgi:hypothetical protein
MIRILRVLTICLAAVVATPAVANLIVNGSFETPAAPVGGTAIYGAGSTAITGWTVVGVGSDSVALVSTSFTQSGVTFQAQDGQQWIDLAGNASNALTSGATQSIATVPGGLYSVSFYVGSADDNVNNFFFPSTIDLSINGGPRVHFTNPIAPPNMLNWQQFIVPFVATGSSTSLTFYNGGASNNFLSALDNVVVEGVVPEPSSVILTGLGAIGFLGRRRTRL